MTNKFEKCLQNQKSKKIKTMNKDFDLKEQRRMNQDDKQSYSVRF